MLIECTYGPVTTEIMGTPYSFTPDEFGRNVVEVWIPQHIRALLAVTYYREVPKEPVELVLTSITPDTAELGSADLVLACTGEGFFSDSVIVFNGGVEATTYVSPTELTTIVKPSTATAAGSFPVLVRNYDGKESAAVNFSFTEVVIGGGGAPLSADPAAADPDAPMPVTLINGIGAALETRLEGIGVTDVRQIAAWTEEEATKIDEDLGLGGRIARDKWIEQAKALVG